MNDNDDGIPSELKEVIEKGVHITAILCSINDPSMASKAVAVAVAHLLCYRMKNEAEAYKALEMIIDDIDAAVMTTSKFGFTSWVDGSAH